MPSAGACTLTRACAGVNFRIVVLRVSASCFDLSMGASLPSIVKTALAVVCFRTYKQPRPGRGKPERVAAFATPPIEKETV